MVVLKDSDIFTTFADVWIFSSLQNSEYALKTDFFCNYIMAKGYSHQSQPAPEEIQGILKQSELFLTFNINSNSTFLFSTHDRVPGKWILVIPKDGLNSTDWIQKSFEKSKSLKANSVKIFLPEEWLLSDVSIPTDDDSVKEVYVVSESAPDSNFTAEVSLKEP